MATQGEFEFEAFTCRMTFEEAMKLFVENYWRFLPSYRCTKTHIRRLNSYFNGKHLDDISKDDVSALRRYFRGLGLKDNTVNKYQMIVRRLYNKLSEWKEAKAFNLRRVNVPDRNPAAGVPMVAERNFKRNVAWKKADIQKLIETAISMRDLNTAETIEMLYLTRLRPSDLFRITRKNIDINHGILSGVQNKTITTRLPSGVSYFVAITPKMGKILKRRMDTIKRERLFAVSDELTAEQALAIFRKRFKKVCELSKLPWIQVRDLRPSSATLLMDNNVDPETVAESLGHTSLRMLPTYTPRSLAHQQRAQAILENPKTEILDGRKII